ncbi:TPA: signal peptidase II [Candidatus Woesearchaeota archaeon]|nr:signal peptidase II [Candidatus Woesearchaeota archaeon]
MVKSSRSYVGLFAVLSVVTLIFDQITKRLVFYYKPEWQWSFLKIHYLTNTGAAFGLFQNHIEWLTLLSVVVAISTLFVYKHLPQSFWPQFAGGLFLGGVVGNLTDRLLYGYVIDFIDLTVWPAFNIADSAITLGVILIVFTINKK